MTSPTDWSRYDECGRCGAQRGRPCRALRQWMGRTYVTEQEMLAPHHGRTVQR